MAVFVVAQNKNISNNFPKIQKQFSRLQICDAKYQHHTN